LALGSIFTFLPSQVGEPVYNVNQHPPGFVGVGGMYTFKFKALKAGNAKIGFSYGRPWEKDTPAADTKTVSVVVDGSSEEWSEAH